MILHVSEHKKAAGFIIHCSMRQVDSRDQKSLGSFNNGLYQPNLPFHFSIWDYIHLQAAGKICPKAQVLSVKDSSSWRTAALRLFQVVRNGGFLFTTHALPISLMTSSAISSSVELKTSPVQRTFKESCV